MMKINLKMKILLKKKTVTKKMEKTIMKIIIKKIDEREINNV